MELQKFGVSFTSKKNLDYHCPFCQETFETRENIILTDCCQNYIHKNCCQNWKKDICPCCGITKKINEQEQEEFFDKNNKILICYNVLLCILLLVIYLFILQNNQEYKIECETKTDKTQTKNIINYTSPESINELKPNITNILIGPNIKEMINTNYNFSFEINSNEVNFSFSFSQTNIIYIFKNYIKFINQQFYIRFEEEIPDKPVYYSFIKSNCNYEIYRNNKLIANYIDINLNCKYSFQENAKITINGFNEFIDKISLLFKKTKSTFLFSFKKE